MKPSDLARPAPLLLLLACGTDPAPSTNLPPGPPSSSQPATSASTSTSVATCADRAAVQAHYQQVCAVTGTYTIKPFPDKKGGLLDEWPVLILADGTEVMLESIWDKDRKPDSTTTQRLQGKRVEAVGTLHSSPPRESPANFGFPCLSPVRSLQVAAEPPSSPPSAPPPPE